MVQPRELAARFEAYGDWRKRLALGVSALHEWLREQELTDARVDLKVQQVLERLHQDKLVVAFVAEFSRGKSELINAIFFADFGARLLPTTAGRTTMCPTELLYDATRPPSIRLLPIETRLKDAAVQELRNYADEWVTFPLDLSDAGKMSEALSRVSEVKRVSVALARALGLEDDEEPDNAGRVAGRAEDRVEVPCWRHAIINFPHPLLQQGLVIVDTPGLNAVGTEPELTLGLLPSAHVVLFVLAADAGVTKTDLEVWKRDLAGDDPAQRAGRIVVLNKIDSLWDELKPEAAVAAEIDRQVVASAALLNLPPVQVFPVSAQKGLLAKVNGDDALLRKSRLPALEDALSRNLIPAKHTIVGAATQAEVRALAAGVSALLEARQTSIAEQLAELRELRGKNQDVVLHMMDRVNEEKALFERGLQRFTALRTVFTEQTNALFDVIGLESLRTNAGRTRRGIERSPFTKGVRGAMSDFFTAIRRDFDDAGRRSAEIHDLMEAMYARFSKERGTETFTPPSFSILKYQKEIDRFERAYNQHFNTLWNMLSKAKFSLTRRFFETIASRVKHVYDIANRDVEGWLRAVMSPLETEVREHHLQLKRRLESVERIHSASGELEARIGELEQQHDSLAEQIAALMRSVAAIDAIALQPEALPAAANA
jgi:CII-binding regulator of phage lambda lysogenization HflD